MRQIKVGSATPWGKAESVKAYGEQGIVAVTTPSHGGIYVPNHLLKHMPERYRAYAKQWSDSENWYEEDCAWACVVVTFQELFKPDDVEIAKRTVAEWVDKK